MRWKFVWLMTAVLLVLLLALQAGWLWSLHHSRSLNPSTQLTHPFFTGFASAGDFPRDPKLQCVTLPLPPTMTLASKPSSKDLLDSRMRGSDEWAALTERMQPGDLIHEYSYASPPPAGLRRPDAFGGLSWGYVVIRGKCVVGMFGTSIE